MAQQEMKPLVKKKNPQPGAEPHTGAIWEAPTPPPPSPGFCQGVHSRRLLPARDGEGLQLLATPSPAPRGTFSRARCQLQGGHLAELGASRGPAPFPTPLPACWQGAGVPPGMLARGGSGLVVLGLGTSRADDQREKYPTEEDLNQRSPGKPQRMDAGSMGRLAAGAGRAGGLAELRGSEDEPPA